MQVLSDLRDLTPNQRNAVLASFLGWTLEAFDFFIIVFVLKDIAAEFQSRYSGGDGHPFSHLRVETRGRISLQDGGGQIWATTNPDDRYPVLLGGRASVGFAPSLTALIILRGLYGIAKAGNGASVRR